MATELLERIIIRHFDEQSVTYSTLRHDVVEIRLPPSIGGYHLQIVDHEFSEPLIEFGVTYMVRFPENQVPYALTMCNKINRLAVGKFSVGEDGDVSYSLDWPVSDSAQPDDVRRMLTFVTMIVSKFYPVIMRVRWANATVEQALERQDNGGILSDEQIRKWMLEGDDSEE